MTRRSPGHPLEVPRWLPLDELPEAKFDRAPRRGARDAPRPTFPISAPRSAAASDSQQGLGVVVENLAQRRMRRGELPQGGQDGRAVAVVDGVLVAAVAAENDLVLVLVEEPTRVALIADQ